MLYSWLFLSFGMASAEDCVDDGMENNDVMIEAISLTAGSFTGLVVCPGDSDWFAVEPNAGELLNISLEFLNVLGDFDLKLFEANGVLLASSLTATDNENIQYYAADSSVLFVEVSFFGTASATTTNTYTIDVSYSVPPVCQSDEYEPNDTIENAISIGVGTHEELTVCEHDPDWFLFSLNEAEEITVVAEHSLSEGDLDLEIVAPDGSNCKSSSDGSRKISV